MAGNHYFSKFSKIYYQGKLVTDISQRFKIRDVVKAKLAVFYKYNVKDGERADIIAEKYYDDASLDWLIYLINDIQNPYYDWQMSYRDWNEYMIVKYGSIETAHQTDHHYEKITQVPKLQDDGTLSPEQTIIVDRTQYLALNNTLKRRVTCYDYEEQLNVKRGEIYIVDRIYVNQILKEVAEIFK